MKANGSRSFSVLLVNVISCGLLVTSYGLAEYGEISSLPTGQSLG